jgi:hypothetical protein
VVKELDGVVVVEEQHRTLPRAPPSTSSYSSAISTLGEVASSSRSVIHAGEVASTSRVTSDSN